MPIYEKKSFLVKYCFLMQNKKAEDFYETAKTAHKGLNTQ